jgi:hypothetical protein
MGYDGFSEIHFVNAHTLATFFAPSPQFKLSGKSGKQEAILKAC